ncbi:MAG TPA: hypothetical protein VFS02_05345 [Telluria sp.]|nr:hypothetical protein [Telluria sp.]
MFRNRLQGRLLPDRHRAELKRRVPVHLHLSSESLVGINRRDGSFAAFGGLTKNGHLVAPGNGQCEEKYRFVRQSRSRSDWRSHRGFASYFSRPDSFRVGHTNNVQPTGSPSGLQELTIRMNASIRQ